MALLTWSSVKALPDALVTGALLTFRIGSQRMQPACARVAAASKVTEVARFNKTRMNIPSNRIGRLGATARLHSGETLGWHVNLPPEV
jgi:hypothetical protein